MLLINLVQVRIQVCCRRWRIAVIFSRYLSLDTGNTCRRSRIFWSLDVHLMLFIWRMRSDYEIIFYPVARTENEGALWPGCCVCILISVPVASHINLPGRSPSQYRPNSMRAPRSQLPPPLSTSYTQPDFVPFVISYNVYRKTSPGDSVGRVQLKCDGTRWRTGGEVKGNWWMEWVASTLHTTSEHGVCSITTHLNLRCSIPKCLWNKRWEKFRQTQQW